MTRDCQHGHLARSCEICERDERIVELTLALKSAKNYFEMLERATGVIHWNLKEIRTVLGDK